MFHSGKSLAIVSLLFACTLFCRVQSHGRLMDPAARSSMWRTGLTRKPIDYNDNELFCGGFQRQWSKNKGKCGVCGDAWDIPEPRPHELGGDQSTYDIARVYSQGQEIDVWVQLTASHLGWFEFRLCPLTDSFPHNEATQECLNETVLQLANDNGTRFYITSFEQVNYHINLRLPENITCDFCVFQWHYNTGTHWHSCLLAGEPNGCGPQETFRGCANIAIKDDEKQQNKPTSE